MRATSGAQRVGFVFEPKRRCVVWSVFRTQGDGFRSSRICPIATSSCIRSGFSIAWTRRSFGSWPFGTSRSWRRSHSASVPKLASGIGFARARDHRAKADGAEASAAIPAVLACPGSERALEADRAHSRHTPDTWTTLENETLFTRSDCVRLGRAFQRMFPPVSAPRAAALA